MLSSRGMNNNKRNVPANASTASSCCSDIREINEAKVANILSYLDSVHTPCFSPPPQHPSANPQENTSSVHHDPSSFSNGVEGMTVPSATGSAAGVAVAPHNLYESSPPPLAVRRPPQQHAFRASVGSVSGLSAGCGGGGGGSVLNDSTNNNQRQVYQGIKSKMEAMRGTISSLSEENNQLRNKVLSVKQREATRVGQIQDAARNEVSKLEKQTSAVMDDIVKATKEREVLQRKVDSLKAEKLRSEEDKSAALSRLQSTHAATLSEMKGKLILQEKAKREQWASKEAKKIKEATLKAMEPDIALLMNRHKADKARLQEEHMELMRRKDEELIVKEKTLTEIKAKFGRDAEELLLKEREDFRGKLKEESERMRLRLQEDRAALEEKYERAEQFHKAQRHSMQQDIKKLEDTILSLKGKNVEDNATFMARVNDEVGTLMRLKQAELDKKNAELTAEKDSFLQSLQKEQQSALNEKEEQIRRQCELERDKAISVVVQRLEDEHIQQRSEVRDSEKVMKERIVKQDREIERLQNELRVTADQLKQALHTSEGKESRLAALEEELKGFKEKDATRVSEIEAQFETRLHKLDSEWSSRLQRFEMKHVDEVCKLQHEMEKKERGWDHEQDTQQLEMRSMEQKHNTELTNINDRVLVAMSKQETTIQLLQEQVKSLQQQVRERELELERHRELLSQ